MSLPEPNFIDRDPTAITQEMIEKYESDTGKTLQPAQVERVMIDSIAYRETLLRIGVQEAAKQNLVNYATYPALDHLGLLVGCTRNDAISALTTLRFTLAQPQTTNITIAAGTQVQAKDGKQTFQTKEALTIPAGDTTGDVTAEAITAGIEANGYAVGQISELFQPIAYVDSVSNISESSGGADIEDDDSYRERIKLAPEAFSNAGSKGAYVYWAKTAHQSIIDVEVIKASPGVVHVYPLMNDGIPSSEVLDLVDEVLQGYRVRPLTDNVSVLAPTQDDFTIVATITIEVTADQEIVESAVTEALNTYINTLQKKLGEDIVKSKITTAIQSIEGVHEVEVTTPTDTTEVEYNHFAVGTIGTLTYEVLS